MTEEEWLSGKFSYMLIEGLRQAFRVSRTKAGKRRLRLYVCACLRRIWDALEFESQELIERLEAICIGLEPEDNLATLAEKANHRASLHWSTNDWDSMTRFAVYYAMATSQVAEGSSRAEAMVQATLSTRVRARYPSAFAPEVQKVLHDAHTAHVAILHDIFGNPFRPLPPRGFPAEARGLAQAWSDGDTSVLPVLIDALTDLGEDEAAAHLRQPLHVHGCHVIDWILGRQ